MKSTDPRKFQKGAHSVANYLTWSLPMIDACISLVKWKLYSPRVGNQLHSKNLWNIMYSQLYLVRSKMQLERNEKQNKRCTFVYPPCNVTQGYYKNVDREWADSSLLILIMRFLVWSLFHFQLLSQVFVIFQLEMATVIKRNMYIAKDITKYFSLFHIHVHFCFLKKILFVKSCYSFTCTCTV